RARRHHRRRHGLAPRRPGGRPDPRHRGGVHDPVRRLQLARHDRVRPAVPDSAAASSGPVRQAEGAGSLMLFTESTLVFIAMNGVFAFSFYAVLVAGQLSLAQAGIAGLAAFTAASIAPAPADWGPIPTLLIAMGIGMVVGALTAVI